MVATRARWRVEFVLSIGERETEGVEAEAEVDMETEEVEVRGLMVGEEDGWRAKGVEAGMEERSRSGISREEWEGAGEGKAA